MSKQFLFLIIRCTFDDVSDKKANAFCVEKKAFAFYDDRLRVKSVTSGFTNGRQQSQ